MNILKVTDVETANRTILNPKVGDMIFCQNDGMLYTYTDQWIPIEVPDNIELPEDDGTGPQLSLYALNKCIISQLPALTAEAIDAAATAITNACVSGNYYMLYGREMSYFTVFHKKEFRDPFGLTLGQKVIECLNNIGEIMSIDKKDDGAWEIWVKYQDEATLLYLFNYDGGIVEYDA